MISGLLSRIGPGALPPAVVDEGGGGEPGLRVITPRAVIRQAYFDTDLRVFPPREVAGGHSLEFNGVSSKIDAGWRADPFGNIPANDFSVSMWLRMSDMAVHADRKHVFHAMTGGSASVRLVIESATSLRYAVTDNWAWRTIDTVTVINEDVWYHVVMTWDASENAVKLYIGGVSEGAQTATASLTNGTAWRVRFGCRTDEDADTFAACVIGAPAVWNTVLTPAEVAEIFAGGKQFDVTEDFEDYVSSASLVMYYRVTTRSADMWPVMVDSADGGVTGQATSVFVYDEL